MNSIINELKKAISRKVKVRFLLESPKEMGGHVSQDGIALIKDLLPGAEVYVWDPHDRRNAGTQHASVHAKCAIADSTIALVTSANLTDSALQRNMELGLLIKGGNPPRSLNDHLLSLVQTKKIKLI